MREDLIARKDSRGKPQSLCCHSRNVAEISASVSHYPDISKLIAYLHDLGKASEAFQNYINNGGERGSVIHAWQGAFLADELFSDNCASAVLLKEIIGFCVTAHHNRLENGVAPDGSTSFFDKFANTADSKYSFEDIKGKITESAKLEFQKLFDNAKAETMGLLDKIRKAYHEKNSANFALGLFVKYLYSCLVNADRLDAYLFEINEAYSYRIADWDLLAGTFEKNISAFSNTAKIDVVRKSVSDKCKSASDRETGIYQLSVPTGGGKTLSSLRFSLHHCKRYGKKRIIYVIPYLSIIEQTAKNLKGILDLPEDNEVLFEHHSNIIEPEDEKSSETRKLTAADWNSPIILTTMVQFLESVISSKSGKLRKFAAMADSVIIFDEIQSLPIKAVNCFNGVVTFLCKMLNSTIILCSATQPALESAQRKNLLLQENPELINCADDFKDIKRVRVSVEPEMDSDGASDFILEKAAVGGNCLVIVNTKKSALEIYGMLKRKSTDYDILHLSTSMCPIHRLQIIDKVRDCLKDNARVICVSTQLIEAGVDISFSCVVRAMSGLDSIAQAAGRCNRNGESVDPRTIYVFSLKDENLDKLLDIKSGKEITEQIVRNKTGEVDLLDEEVMKEFYRQYFAGKDSRMDYPTAEGETVYAMLSGNDYGKQNYKNKTGNSFPHFIAQAFLTADENFSVIDENTKTVVAMYGDAENLLGEYRKQPTAVFTKKKAAILKKLLKYGVSLYEWQIKKLSEQNALYTLDAETNMIILSENYYSRQTGVVLEVIQDNLII